jgi:hypothetical protein
MPDGEPRDVIVAWGEQGPADLKLPAPPLAVYDFLGREVANPIATMHLTTPVFIVKEENASKALSPIPGPPPPPRVDERACPIVLQANFAEGQIDPNQSAARLKPGMDNSIPLVVYNFSDKAAHVTLSAHLPDGMSGSALPGIDVRPKERLEVPMTVTTPGVIAPGSVIRIDGDCGILGKQVLSFNIIGPNPHTSLPKK